MDAGDTAERYLNPQESVDRAKKVPYDVNQLLLPVRPRAVTGTACKGGAAAFDHTGLDGNSGR